MSAPFFKNDLEVLNYALTLEHVESAFYKQVNGSGKLQGDAAKYLKTIGDHEAAHVSALTNAISKAGGTPVKARASYKFDALGDLSTQAGILAAAATLEDIGVGAYNGAGPEISDKGILATAGSIVQVEANHAAVIRALMNPESNPVPTAFPNATAPGDVLNAVTPVLGPEQ